MTSIISFDVDLHRIHSWSSLDGRVCFNAKEFPYDRIAPHDVILMEVASPLFYEDDPKIIYQKAKWAIFNSFKLGQLVCYLEDNNLLERFRVAPSSEWTCKYPEKVRQEMANVTGEDNHDIREARTMQWFYLHHQSKWVTYETFIAGLSTAGKTSKLKEKRNVR
jgi:hypothetical protein